MSDVNVYSNRSVIFLEYFWGYIDGRNALQTHTIWNIHMKPNINIHFLKFVLFDNYWYCDYEYLRVSSNNKSSTFCGNRLPWVHDASDTSVKLIFMTPWAGTKNYQLELLYYGAYVPDYKHFVIFIQPSSLIKIHLPNTEQNEFESFHFISNNRLDIVELEAINTCNKGQVVCNDGPGFKSPVLQFTYNQSEWECQSSTFQMMCKFSRVDDVCTNHPRLQYRAIRARNHQLKSIRLHEATRCKFRPLIIDTESKGTTKYIYYHPDTASLRGCGLVNIKMDISFPYMLSEGYSCMYGGLYVVQSISSKDSEVLSLCTLTVRAIMHISDLNNVSVIIIHYSEYSTEKILFRAVYSLLNFPDHLDLNQTYTEDTLSITVPSSIPTKSVIHSYQFKLKKLRYINISVDAYIHIQFNANLRTSCISTTRFYPPDLGNVFHLGNQIEIPTSYYRSTKPGANYFHIKTLVHFVVINLSACSLVRAPVWDIFIKIHDKNELQADGVHKYNLPTAVLHLRLNIETNKRGRQFWTMVHLRKPEDVAVYAIWRVRIRVAGIVLRVRIEILGDHWSSWYSLRKHDNLYITISKAVNIMLFSNIAVAPSNCKSCFMEIWFIRHFIHDERITKYITGQAPHQFYFSFHNQR